jgi:PAS domain S-box-containing protein
MDPDLAERYHRLDSLDDRLSADVPMWIFDQATLAFLEVNEAAIRTYGYSREEFLAMAILGIRPPNELTKLIRSALHPHPAGGDRWLHRTREGVVFPVRIFSQEVLFKGRCAELVTARPVEEPSAEPEGFSLEVEEMAKP